MFGSTLRSLVRIVAVSLLVAPHLATAGSVRYSLVSRAVVDFRLKQYADDNQQREWTLKQLFANAGCDAEHLSEQPVKGSNLPNIICVLPGDSGRIIIVGAHFDHVSEGDGVVDNWSGASLLPSLYEAVKAEPHQHTYIFIGFTDEEKGEVGSHYYAAQMSKQTIAATDAMVNMDTLGLGPTEVWLSHSNKLLAGILFYLAKQTGIPATAVNVEHIGSTDSVQFAQRQVPSITIHTLTQKTWNDRILHTSKDRISEIHFDDYYQTYRLIAAYLAALDQFLPPAPNGSPTQKQ